MKTAKKDTNAFTHVAQLNICYKPFMELLKLDTFAISAELTALKAAFFIFV